MTDGSLSGMYRQPASTKAITDPYNASTAVYRMNAAILAGIRWKWVTARKDSRAPQPIVAELTTGETGKLSAEGRDGRGDNG